MKKSRYIIYIAVVALLAVFFMLGRDAQRLFLFEREQLRQQVESAAGAAADSIQNYNGSLLNNTARMFTDKHYSDKVAFAAGFTHNASKISVILNDDTTAAPVKHSAHAENDSIPLFTPEYIKANVKYNPKELLGVPHFDSVFRKQLQKADAVVPFAILIAKKWERFEKPAGDTIFSQQFILDFYEPVIYSVHYVIPSRVVYLHMYTYLLSGAVVCLLLVAGTIFFYRSFLAQQQQAMFRQSLFGNITHELKTPLTSMQLIIDNAQGHISGNDMVSIPARHVQFAADELNRMKLIVDSILSFSKMGRGQFAWNSGRTDLDDVILQAIKIMEIKAANANAVINYEAGNKLYILGDAVLLVNAISAIMDNALKYTQRQPVITITLTRKDKHAIIAVKDTGTGIPPQYRKKVYEPFFRIPAGNVHHVGGHGLGLSFVKQVTELHRGKIAFESDENGTIFHLTLHLI